MAKKKDSEKRRTPLMTLQAVEEEYGPPYTSIRDLVLQGHLPRVQLGDSRRIWVKRTDVEKLIAASTEVGPR